MEELCFMPLKGKWKKENEVWVGESDENDVESSIVSNSGRARIDEICRKII